MINLIPGKLYTLQAKTLTAYSYDDSKPKTLIQDIKLKPNDIFVYLHTRYVVRGGSVNKKHYFILFESTIYTICFYGDETLSLEQHASESFWQQTKPSEGYND